MSTLFSMHNEAHVGLLACVRACLPQLEGLQREMQEAEATSLLRFYRSDLRVYDLRQLVQQAAALFHDIASGGELALPFEIIVQDGLSSRLDLRDSRVWVLSALPVLAALYHCNALVDIHVQVGWELARPPDEPPATWATSLVCIA